MMNLKLTERYAEIRKAVMNEVDTLEDCKNRMCVTDDIDELAQMYLFLTLHAVDLYRLNCDRLFILAESELEDEYERAEEELLKWVRGHGKDSVDSL